MDTYFAPYQEIWNGTKVIVEYPSEIKLPGGNKTFSQYNDTEKRLNQT